MSMAGRNSNGKSKSLKASSQDYTNLLYSDSESDGKVPDLRLPPIKGKKQKRYIITFLIKFICLTGHKTLEELLQNRYHMNFNLQIQIKRTNFGY